MDSECNNSESEDLNKTITNVEETAMDPKTMSRSESPVFKCVNQYKTKRVSRCESSDYDIPSYQINQSVKRRTSGKHESETSGSILPFSPGFSPIQAFSQHFQPPSIHSLGTVAKMGNLVKTDNANLNCKSLCEAKKSSVFEGLGMMDKDISWISSMATPPPQVPGSGFNTIEKATFFPEENFQNIQPRALFSPTHDDDFGCKPLSFSSESEDDSYKTDIRLSDVCTSLKQLDVRSLEQMPIVNEMTINEKNDSSCETSPVIKMRKQKKLGSIKTKRKQNEMKSTELGNKSESSKVNNVDLDVSEKLKSNKVNNVNSESTNFIDDDSFQSISFSSIDELCKTLANATEQGNSSAGSKTFENDCKESVKDKSDVTLVSKTDSSFRKQFYRSKVDSNISSVPSRHNLHFYAKAFENTNGVILKRKVIDRSVAEKGVVRFDSFAKGSSKSNTVLHSGLSIEMHKTKDKKLKSENDESSNWDTMSKYLSESQLNVSESEIFKTVEKLEKTLGSQENKVLGNLKEMEKPKKDKCESKNDDFQLKSDEKVASHPISKTDLKDTINSLEAQSSVVSTSVSLESSFVFKTTFASEVTLPNVVERKQSSKSFQHLGTSTSMGGFCSGSGKQIQISGKALEKAKLLMAECEEKSLKETSEDLASKWIEVFQGSLESSLSCDKIRENQNNKECLGLSDVTVAGSGISVSEILSQDKELLAEFSKSHESFQNPNISAFASGELENLFTKKEEKMRKDGDTMFEGTGENLMVGFSTASGSRVKITKEALEKAQELVANCSETSQDISQSLTENWIQNFVSKDPIATKHEETHIGTRFSTDSGSSIKISEEALQRAQKLIIDCDQTAEDLECQSLTKNWMQNFMSKPDPVKTRDETHIGIRFSTASGNKVEFTQDALDRAKKLMADCDQTSEEVSQSLTKKWMQSFVNKNSVKTNDETQTGIKFSTASGKGVKITEKALQKAKELMANCDEASEDMTQRLTKNWMHHFVSKPDAVKIRDGTQFPTRFSTAPGNKVKVTGEDLDEAKVLKSKCNESSTDACENLTKDWIKDFESKDQKKVGPMGAFSTASGNKIKITEEALQKAKELMVNCDRASEDASHSLTKNWIQNFVSQDPISTKNEETSIATGFLTGSGDKVKVSSHALEKAKASISKCVVENLETYSKVEGNHVEDVTDDFEIDTLMTKFSTASGKGVKVSGEALNKARTFMSKCDESSTKTYEPLTKNWMEDLVINDLIKTEFHNETPATIPPICFSTAAGSEVIVSEDALKKAKENLAEVWSQDLSEKSKNSLLENHDEKSAFSESGKEQETESKRCFRTKDERNTKTKKTNSDKPELLNDLTVDASLFIGGNLSEGDWEEIVPSWLHVYNTSPSMASDRIEMSPVVSHEDGKSSNPAREYIVKSPVLGLSDRFYKKGKKGKGEVKEGETKAEERTSSRTLNVPYKDGGKKMSVKRTSLNLSMDFSAPFKKGKFIEAEVGSGAEMQKSDLDIRDNRMKARLQQENTCKEKKQVKPLRGSHLQKKVSERQKKWMESVGKAFPDMYSDECLKSLGVKEDVLRISVDSAGDFKFSAEDFYGSMCIKNVDGIPAGDGCFLIPDKENKLGVKEVKRAFLASPGVQPNLVPDGWVENHYKWLVWKFSHYERSFPRFFGGQCLNPNNVMLQLKYRYDREIDRNERSALKKILERDDTSIKRMVLCVCGIKKVISGETVEYELSLTDGWYSVSCLSDSALTPFIEKGKLCIGTKLVTQGAVLVNCEQGTSPLQASSDVHLRIFTNSTRRVRWDTKLGFQKNPHNFTISLSSILPQGGQISKIDVIVVRIYPMLYMEKTLEGHSVTRNQRSEEKAELEYCRLQERKIEMIYDEMSKYGIKEPQGKKKMYNGRLYNFERDRMLCDSANKDSNFTDSQEFVEDENDCLTQSNHLDEDMIEKFQEKLNKENLIRRNVSQFLRMKIVDYRKPDYNNPAILTVWNPNEEILSLFSEGKVMSLMNVAVSKSSRTYKSLQINTTRQTLYKAIVSKAKYPARQVTPLREVVSKICPVFEEVDLVGIVILIKDVAYGSRSSQIIYLADLDFHFVGIVFWGSPKDYGWENVLKLQSIVACSNLQWKKSCGLQEVPSLQVNESTVFTENPKHSYLKEEVEKLKENMPEDKNDFLTKCEEKLTEKLEESKWQGHSGRNSSGNDSIPKDSFSAKFRHINGFESKPMASSTPVKPFSVCLNSSEAEPSPIQKRMQKLQSYGEPPPLIPLIVTNNLRKYKKKC